MSHPWEPVLHIDLVASTGGTREARSAGANTPPSTTPPRAISKFSVRK
jgi:hypothetical protein